MGVREIHVVNADGESLDLSTHAQDFEDFILSQVCQEHLSWLLLLEIIYYWKSLYCRLWIAVD